MESVHDEEGTAHIHHLFSAALNDLSPVPDPQLRSVYLCLIFTLSPLVLVTFIGDWRLGLFLLIWFSILLPIATIVFTMFYIEGRRIRSVSPGTYIELELITR